MNRVVVLLDDTLLKELQADVERCGCGSLSTHIRHLLTDILRTGK